MSCTNVCNQKLFCCKILSFISLNNRGLFRGVDLSRAISVTPTLELVLFVANGRVKMLGLSSPLAKHMPGSKVINKPTTEQKRKAKELYEAKKRSHVFQFSWLVRWDWLGVKEMSTVFCKICRANLSLADK